MSIIAQKRLFLKKSFLVIDKKPKHLYNLKREGGTYETCYYWHRRGNRQR